MPEPIWIERPYREKLEDEGRGCPAIQSRLSSALQRARWELARSALKRGKEVSPRIHSVLDRSRSGRCPQERSCLRGNERKDDTSGSLMLAYRGAGKGGARFVRKRRREVLRGGWARPLLGCKPGEPQQVRRGVHQLLLRLPQEPEPRGMGMAEGEVRQVLGRGHDARPLRDGVCGRCDLPAYVPDRILPPRLQHYCSERGPEGEVPGQVHPQRLFRPARGRAGTRAVRGAGRQVRPQGRQALYGRVEG